MKVSHILEAAPARDTRPKELNSRLKIKQKGDLVWHLHRFFEEGQENTEHGTNPEYRKVEKQILNQVLDTLTPEELAAWNRYHRTSGWDGDAYRMYRKVRDRADERFNQIKTTLPEESIPTANTRRYYPNRDLIVTVDNIPINYITVRIKNGQITSMSFESKRTGTRSGKQFRIKQSQKMEPRELFTVYQKLDY